MRMRKLLLPPRLLSTSSRWTSKSGLIKDESLLGGGGAADWHPLVYHKRTKSESFGTTWKRERGERKAICWKFLGVRRTILNVWRFRGKPLKFEFQKAPPKSRHCWRTSRADGRSWFTVCVRFWVMKCSKAAAAAASLSSSSQAQKAKILSAKDLEISNASLEIEWSGRKIYHPLSSLTGSIQFYNSTIAKAISKVLLLLTFFLALLISFLRPSQEGCCAALNKNRVYGFHKSS